MAKWKPGEFPRYVTRPRGEGSDGEKERRQRKWGEGRGEKEP